MRKTVCFAYFGDGKFLGWYADSFGTITKNTPKVYVYTPEQVETIKRNFRYKLNKEKSNLGDLVKGLSVVDDSLAVDKQKLSPYKQIELRVVECPFYDGPNPNFDEERHKNWTAYKRKPMYEPENNYWIYADYTLVKGWATAEPVNYLEIITSE